MNHKPWRWALFALLLSVSFNALDRAWSQGQTKALTSEERLRRDITYLASDELDGRGPGTKGIDLAADYIALQFKEAGLKPAGVNGTWFQPFIVGTGASTKLGENPVLKLNGPDDKEIELKLGEDFQIQGNSGSGTITAPLVFAGYGITDKDLNFDEYKDLDVAGKIVVLIRRTPRPENKPAIDPNHGAIETKFGLAAKNKAAAILLINDASEAANKLLAFDQFTNSTPFEIPTAHVNRTVLEPVFQSGLKKTIAEIEKAIDKDLKPLSGPLTGWSATIDCKVARKGSRVKNVVGVSEGAGPLADETVVVGAHYDHLGISAKTKAIYRGADDNGSGTTSVMEIARRFGAMKNRQGRRIVFMTFAAEEIGLLGSAHYCNKEPLFPLDKTVAMVNLDMVGRLRNFDEDKKVGKPALEKGGKLHMEAVGSGKGFEHLVEKFNEEFGFELLKKQPGFGPSDHGSFYRVKIPVLCFHTGLHPEYHQPSDKSDLINVPGMKRICDMAERLTEHFATTKDRPEYLVTKGSGGPGAPGVKSGPRLGFTPDYRYDGKIAGAKVQSVHADGVGRAAGLKANDIITEVAGKAVNNLDDYITIMMNQKVGETVSVVVIRDDSAVTLKADLK